MTFVERAKKVHAKYIDKDGDKFVKVRIGPPQHDIKYRVEIASSPCVECGKESSVFRTAPCGCIVCHTCYEKLE